ncbi:MAG: helix-turn-helix transcriptional regulator [Ignavibacteria bacterium]|nr:helix-turn-helix transcriptional regulator [Ignavibacteria bacterium]MBK6419928.1 helix-turn-helix transcriptional regulator [Ignavibacteria bacterium]MBK7033379.1 helix-turn-helix transcriptional regulator [Ignavibacteria bacterium]MBK7184330.1 helix-turn-helix transcriptional regulator [Ignavibacteria bacterium]MBK7413134.1 helix-turn-helix transcriptional regulator [Ignavibacteria bacterium]
MAFELICSVREHRKEKGLTQGELAQRIGVSRQSINYIENGSISPSIKLALLIALELDCSIESIFILRGTHD